MENCLDQIHILGLPVVLKFLKFHNCPEISNCPETLLIWSEYPDMDLFYAVTTLFFTSHDYVYVADVECQVMLSLVTLYCFMSNIAFIVTFLGLQF